ncbi:syntaxin-1A isoform X2 [Aethina tumida]|uniref:syntaxin-1A isoform X2 n=1 Tax=Aethina tumida TaxID=116153 RepID=UPI0021486F3C|nr:syntaxin-1A isoform X2 [Aethina tumida]
MRDRLAALKAASKDHSNNETNIQIEAEPLNQESSSLKNTFERGQVIQQWIDSIEKNNEQMREYTTKSQIQSVFDQKGINDKIEDLFAKNKAICMKISGKLKEYENELKTTATHSAEERIKSVQYNSLNKRYVEAFKTSNSIMEKHSNNIKDSIKSQLSSKGLVVTDQELDELIEKGEDIQVFTDNILAETAEAKRMLQDIEERHEHLLKIERTLVEVRDMFIQISILVDSQK